MSQSTEARYDIESVAVAELQFDVLTATKIWSGTCVATDASGNAQPCADTSGLVFQGVARESVNNSAGDSGALQVRVEPVTSLGHLELDAVNPNGTWIGFKVYFTDDHTVSKSVSNCLAGECVAVEKGGAAGRVTVNVNRRA